MTKYAWSRAESSERVKRVRVVEVDTSDRGPSVGGIGTLKTPQTQEEKDEDLVQEHDVVMTPMLSASCRIPGSVNNGRGEYGVVTVMSVARALTREAGGGSDAFCAQRQSP